MKKKYAYYQGRQYDPKNPRDARRIVDDPRQANGPLVHAPGENNRRYIGFTRVRADAPVLDEDGDTIPIEEFEVNDLGHKRHVWGQLQFEWVFDPTPIAVPITFQNMKTITRLNRAVADGDLLLLTAEEAAKATEKAIKDAEAATKKRAAAAAKKAKAEAEAKKKAAADTN